MKGMKQQSWERLQIEYQKKVNQAEEQINQRGTDILDLSKRQEGLSGAQRVHNPAEQQRSWTPPEQESLAGNIQRTGGKVRKGPVSRKVAPGRRHLGIKLKYSWLF